MGFIASCNEVVGTSHDLSITYSFGYLPIRALSVWPTCRAGLERGSGGNLRIVIVPCHVTLTTQGVVTRDPSSPQTPMSRFRVTDGYTSQKGFAHLPKVGDSVPGISQPRGSLDSGSISSRFSGISSRRAAQLEEGDLITGTIDITHERAYMLPPIQDEDRADEKKALVCTRFSLVDDST